MSKAKIGKLNKRTGKLSKGRAKTKPYENESNENWRENVCEKLGTLVDDAELGCEIEEALYQQITTRTSHSEKAMFQDSIFKHRYLYALSTLILNLDPNAYVGNKNLIQRVKSGEIVPEQLVSMTPPELFPEKWEEIRKKQQEEEKFLYENQRKATSKRIKCFSCGERQVSYFEAQTRSSDEPMTVFYECLNCGNKWRS